MRLLTVGAAILALISPNAGNISQRETKAGTEPTYDYASAIREQVWERLAGDWKPAHLDKVAWREVGLPELPAIFDTMLTGGSLGRTVVRVG